MTYSVIVNNSELDGDHRYYLDRPIRISDRVVLYNSGIVIDESHNQLLRELFNTATGRYEPAWIHHLNSYPVKDTVDLLNKVLPLSFEEPYVYEASWHNGSPGARADIIQLLILAYLFPKGYWYIR